MNDKISLSKSIWLELSIDQTLLTSNSGTVEWEVNDVCIDKVCR